jgi:glycosyltransferase involved in cell wall biosynthesis
LQEIAATKNNNYNQQVIVVVTPVYNAVKFIDETIASVISQRGEFTIRYHIQDGVLKS